MKKPIRIILLVLAFLCASVFTVTDVYATNSIKITSKSKIKAGGRTHSWFKSNHGYVYCVIS